MNGRSTILILKNEKIESFLVITGISQDSLYSSILFLFYIAEFYDLYDALAFNVSIIDFIDDTQLLTFDNTEESNYQRLMRVHDRCV